MAECRNKVRIVVLVSPTALQATTEGSLLDKKGKSFIDIHTLHYKCTPIYRVTLPSYPTHETKYQIGMAL